MTKATLTFQEFKAGREKWNAEYKAKNEWASDCSDNVTELAYRMYLEGRVPQWAK